MSRPRLPGARAELVDARGVTSPAFYRFFAALQTLQDGNPTDADIAAINAQLVELREEIDALPQQSYPILQVLWPLFSNGLLQNGFAQIGLDASAFRTIPQAWVLQ